MANPAPAPAPAPAPGPAPAGPAPPGGNNGGNGIIANVGLEFDPTDAEVLVFLKNKILSRHEYFPELIPTTNVFGRNPDQLPFGNFMYSNGKRWFFYAIKPQHSLFNGDGYWSPKSEVDIHVRGKVEGFKKELIYYRGMQRAGKRTDWCMHRYSVNPALYAATAVDDEIKHRVANLVVCKIFHKDESTHPKRQKRKRKS